MKLTRVEISPKHNIICTPFTVPISDDEPREVLVVQFAGTYGVGSDGNQDAQYMRAMVVAAIEFVEPSGLIFDLTELRYEWGDRMHWVLHSGHRHYINGDLPYAVVVSPLCEQAISSLFLEEMEEDLSKMHRCLPDALKFLSDG
jgi:hypothetical protein